MISELDICETNDTGCVKTIDQQNITSYITMDSINNIIHMYKGVRHLLKKIRSTEISVGKKDWNVVDK